METKQCFLKFVYTKLAIYVNIINDQYKQTKTAEKVLSKIVVIFLSSAWIAQLFGAGKYAFAILTDISVQTFSSLC
jgi:hypothetical protein